MTTHTAPRTAVLGAGALGLTVAPRLVQRGERVVVIEREPDPHVEHSRVTDAWTFAAPFAQPIVAVDYRRDTPPFATPMPGR